MIHDRNGRKEQGSTEAAVVSLEKVPTFDAFFLGGYLQMMSATGRGCNYPKTEEVREVYFSTEGYKIHNIADII